MKTFTAKFFTVALGLGLMASCTKEPVSPDPEPTPVPGEREKVVFASSSSTSFSFVQGDRIGLFAGEPINEDNVILNVDAEGKITPEKEIYWGQGQKSASAFLAYFPYDSTYTKGGTVTFAAKLDQSKEADYKASDLLCAIASASPKDEQVNFNFTHKMVRLNLCFDNRSGKTISKVEVKDVKTQINFNLSSGAVEAAGEATTIVAASGSIESKQVYSVIIAPQTTNPTILITMSDGKVFEASLEKEQAFESGKSYDTMKNPIIIVSDVISVSFSISDWADGGQLNFNGGEEPVGDYTTLAELAATATTKSTNFDVTVKNVIVTKVSNKYVHIEDGTAGIFIFSSSHGLSEGDCINGNITGSIQLYDGYSTLKDATKAFAEITSISTSKATVTKGVELPVTELTLGELLNDFKKYYNRRVLLKDITVTTGISSKSQSGTISQGESQITIFNKSKAVTLESGLTGNLTCWPIAHQGNFQVNVYTQDNFQEVVAPAEETAFTKTENIGAYSLSGETVTAEYLPDNESQVSASSLTYRIIKPLSGSMLTVKISGTTVSVGRSCSAEVSSFGSTGVEDYSGTLICVRKDKSKIWLRNSDSTKGFIVGIEE